MKKTANFNIIDTETLETVKIYKIDYTDNNHLHLLFQESREVWEEFLVKVECDTVELTSLVTYREEILQGF